MGRIMSLIGRPPGIKIGTIERHKSGRIMRVNMTIYVNRARKTMRLHNLMLVTFVGPRPDGMEGCHNDGNPLNNVPANLRWDTHQANMLDMYRHGTKSNPPLHRGESHPNATIPDSDVAKIRATPYYRGLFSDLAKKHRISLNSISRIYNGASRQCP